MSRCKKNKFRYVAILIETENIMTDMWRISDEKDSTPIYFENNPTIDNITANTDKNIVPTPT